MAKKPAAGASGRHEFSPKTKKLIAERASYRCVVPGCKVPTIGPGAKSDDVSNAGSASHIYSAAENGPRGRAGLTPTQIKSPQNGIWTCRTHGTEIDNNKGERYPAALLLGWKALQEAQLRREQDGRHTPVGWIHELKVVQSWLFKSDEVLTLGKATLLQGPPFGKTALCDWISTSLGGKHENRWISSLGLTILDLKIFSPEEQAIELKFDDQQRTFAVNGVTVSEAPKRGSAVFFRQSAWSLSQRNDDDDELIGQLLGFERDVVRSLIHDIQRNGTKWGRLIAFYHEEDFEDDDHGNPVPTGGRTWILRRGGPTGVTFRGLAGSEQERILIEFAAALARERADSGPTVLLLDGSGWNFDDGNMSLLAEYLISQPFQTILTMRGGWQPDQAAPWWGWSRVVLTGKQYSAQITSHDW